MNAEEVAGRVRTKGYAMIPQFDPSSSTESIALRLGTVMDVSTLLPNVPLVQTLRPRKPSREYSNQYSGTYGIEDFPLHSDLAHWYLPPRYLLLRCKVGVKDVETIIVSYSTIATAVGERTLKQALVVPRRKIQTQTICPLPVIFVHEGAWGMRWDSLFLSPINEAAKRTFDTITSRRLYGGNGISTTLLEPGDTLVIDNWRMLHGRSAVPDHSMGRVIERIYLNRLGGEC